MLSIVQAARTVGLILREAEGPWARRHPKSDARRKGPLEEA